jgi:hypothetical protein
MTNDSPCVGSLVAFARGAFVRGLRGEACVRDLRGQDCVRDQVGGALSSAAVPRVCLGQTAPPLCRCAKCTTDLILRVWWACLLTRIDLKRRERTLQEFDRAPYPTGTQAWRLVCTAQRHKGGGRRPGDSRGAVHTKCQGEHSQAHGRTTPRAASPVFQAKPTTGKSMPFGSMHFTLPTSS